MRNYRHQKGFTLIELIAVLVLLGIIAAISIPKFINLTDEAHAAAIESLAKSMESASALNHAVDVAKEAGLSSDAVTGVSNCQHGVNLLAEGALPANHTIGDVSIADKAVVQCTVTRTNPSASTTFHLIGAVN